LFGIAGLPCDLKDPKEIVSRADKALYESKNAGRNRVTVYQKLR
jgi:PleD family two-component response regulator